MQETLPNHFGIPRLTRQQTGPEIAERVRCARNWCQRHWGLLCNPNLNSRFKFQLYKAFVRPILTYGCEVWNLHQSESKRLLRFESAILLAIYKSKYPPRHPNRLKPNLLAVYKRFRGSDVVDHVNCERLQWTALLKYEEKKFRVAKRPPLRSVHWWDNEHTRAYKHCKRYENKPSTSSKNYSGSSPAPHLKEQTSVKLKDKRAPKSNISKPKKQNASRSKNKAPG